jgi:hypothetical protein
MSRPSPFAHHTPAAGLTRAAEEPCVVILPPRWPLVVGLVLVVATTAGLVARSHHTAAGNVVRLRVHASPDVDSQLAALVVEAELVRQLRAMRLDVGGPEARQAAVEMDAAVHARAVAESAWAYRVEILADVKVMTEPAGTAFVHAEGLGEDRGAAVVSAARQSAWQAVGEAARHVANHSDGASALNRITDGRSSVRVFASLHENLHQKRRERFHAMHQARLRPEDRSQALSVPGESVRLLGVPAADRALVTVEASRPVLLPTQRREPFLLDGLEALELRYTDGSRHRLMSALRFAQRAVSSSDGLHAAVSVEDGDGSHAICVVSLAIPRRRCLPLGQVFHVQPLALSPQGAVVLRTADCAGGCPERLVWWDAQRGLLEHSHLNGDVTALFRDNLVSLQRIAKNGQAEELEWRVGHPPKRVRSKARLGQGMPGTEPHAQARPIRAAPGLFEWLGADKAVALVDGPLHRQLSLIQPSVGLVTPLTHHGGDTRRAVVAPGQHRLFYEVAHPDPDVEIMWSEVRYVSL